MHPICLWTILCWCLNKCERSINTTDTQYPNVLVWCLCVCVCVCIIWEHLQCTLILWTFGACLRILYDCTMYLYNWIDCFGISFERCVSINHRNFITTVSIYAARKKCASHSRIGSIKEPVLLGLQPVLVWAIPAATSSAAARPRHGPPTSLRPTKLPPCSKRMSFWIKFGSNIKNIYHE